MLSHSICLNYTFLFFHSTLCNWIPTGSQEQTAGGSCWWKRNQRHIGFWDPWADRSSHTILWTFGLSSPSFLLRKTLSVCCGSSKLSVSEPQSRRVQRHRGLARSQPGCSWGRSKPSWACVRSSNWWETCSRDPTTSNQDSLLLSPPITDQSSAFGKPGQCMVLG